MAAYDYTPEQLRQMQREAAERVREMQRRARARLEGGQPVPRPQPPERPIPHLSPPVSPPPREKPSAGLAEGLGGLLGQMGIRGGDSDRMLLMLLLMLLSREGSCSPGLIAALFWLMMG